MLRAGEPATRVFCQPSEFSGSLADLIAGGAAAVSIEAVDPGDIVEIDWARIDALSARHPPLTPEKPWRNW